jgi:hypothetical protein
LRFGRVHEDFEARPLFEQSYAIVRAMLDPTTRRSHCRPQPGRRTAQTRAPDDALRRYETLRIRQLRFAEDHQPTLLNSCRLPKFGVASAATIRPTRTSPTQPAGGKRLGETHSDVVVGKLNMRFVWAARPVDEARGVDAVLQPGRSSPTNQAIVDKAISAVTARSQP